MNVLQRSKGSHTSLELTFRSRLAVLMRRSRALVRDPQTLDLIWTVKELFLLRIPPPEYGLLWC